MDAEPALASLSLTHVNYDPSDPVSHISAFLALVPQALCVSYASLIYATREVEILLMFTGQMACEGLNFLLKRHIKEERPKIMHGKGYGMPSSHAQFVTFFAVYLALFLMARHRPHETDTHTPLSTLERGFVSLLVACGAAAVAGSRVYLGYHTSKQVWVGIAAGASFAICWFIITTYLRRSGWVDWGLDTKLASGFRMRDLVVEEDLPDAGWNRWQTRKRKRSIKAS